MCLTSLRCWTTVYKKHFIASGSLFDALSLNKSYALNEHLKSSTSVCCRGEFRFYSAVCCRGYIKSWNQNASRSSQSGFSLFITICWFLLQNQSYPEEKGNSKWLWISPHSSTFSISFHFSINLVSKKRNHKAGKQHGQIIGLLLELYWSRVEILLFIFPNHLEQFLNVVFSLPIRSYPCETHKTGTQSRLPACGAAPSSQITCSSAPAWWPGRLSSCLPGYLSGFHKSELDTQHQVKVQMMRWSQTVSCNLFSLSSCRDSRWSTLQSCRVATLSMVSSITSFKSVSSSLHRNKRQR